MKNYKYRIEQAARRFIMRYRLPLLFYHHYQWQLELLLETNPKLKRRWEAVKKNIARKGERNDQ